MSFDMDWSPDFCLACDKQTTGGVYCSESCRLAEYDRANSGSEASSPATPHWGASWPATTKNETGFFLPQAFDFKAHRSSTASKAASQPAVRTPLPRPQSSPENLVSTKLTKSPSQSSRLSMQSISSISTNADQPQLSEEAMKELRAYANSFDQSRYSRRGSAY